MFPLARIKSMPVAAKLFLLFGFSFLIRLAHIAAIRSHPLFVLPTVDAESYDLWARAILGGNWLGSTVFYQDPLYSYFLAGFYAVIGRNFFALAVFQGLLDSATVVMLAVLGKRFFSPAVGWVAAFAAAVYGASVFYAGVFEKTSVTLFFTVAILLALSFAAQRPKPALFFFTGILLGLGILMRGNLFLFVPAVVLWVAYVHRPLFKTRLLALELSLIAGLAIVILPLTARNWVVARDLVLTTSQGGWNFYVGTAKESTGWLATPRGVRTVPRHEEEDNRKLAEQALGRPLKPSEVSRYWFREGLKFIVEEPGKYLRVIGMKFLLMCNSVELPDSYDYYFYRQLSAPLRLLPLGFGLVFPLGLAGIFLAWRRRELDRRRSILVIFLGVYASSLLLFYITGRYRLPLVPVLLLFGSYAALWLVETARRRSYRQLAPLGLAVGVLSALSQIPVGRANPAGSYFMAGNSLYGAGFYPQALEQYERALAGNESRPDLQIGLGLVLQKLGREEESLKAFNKAVELNPSDPQPYGQLSQLYRGRGELARADIYDALGAIHSGRSKADYAKLSALVSQVPSAQRLAGYSLMAFAFYKQGSIPEAQLAWQASLKIKPDQPGTLLNLFLTTEPSDPRRAVVYLRRYVTLAESDPKERPKLDQALRRLEALEQQLEARQPR